MWKPDYELMNYSILPRGSQLPTELPTLAPTTLAVENLQRSGWSEIHQTAVIDAPLSVAQPAACHISGLEWENIARCWQRFTDGKLGEPLFLIAEGFCKYWKVPDTFIAGSAPESTVREPLQALVIIPEFS